MTQLSSRDRMLRTIALQDADHTPCCFMSFAIQRKRCRDNPYESVKAELALGLDSMLFIPAAPRSTRPEHPDLRGLPVRLPPTVKTREWREEGKAGDYPILHKEYSTPAGPLTTSARLSDDWPHGDHLPFLDDYQVPRSLKPLVTEPKDLDALRHLLIPPASDDIARFQKEAAEARAFANEHGILLAGGWGVGLDMADWLCTMQPLMMAAVETPDFVTDLLEIIHQWNMQRMKVVLSAPGGIDLYIRRGWYEGCDMVTPDFHRHAILPRLKAEADLAHNKGAKFGLITTSGTAPLLDNYLAAGIDVLIGIDPIQGTHTDMPLMKQKLGKKVALWGGVSAAVTVEQGSEPEIRHAVRHALKTLGPTGHILSPIDNLTVDTPKTWQNIATFIDEWQHAR